MSISIHALREEGDGRGSGSVQKKTNFYPRPPRGGRQRQRYDGCAGRNFYPRPPRGGRRTLYHKSSLTMRDFYPRPPRGGRRIASGLAVLGLLFLSTPSARRATQKCSEYAASTCNFYPRPPRGGRPGAHRHSGRYDAISIHALREEGDPFNWRPVHVSGVFLSTPSARRATLMYSARAPRTSRHFYPRPPRGGRPDKGNAFVGGNNFYPRPPRGGRLPILPRENDLAKISIHALREEGDGPSRSFLPGCRYFYPRPPRGGRPCTPSPCRRFCGFLSTPSARRATVQHFADLLVRKISIHALREEGDSCFCSW